LRDELDLDTGGSETLTVTTEMKEFDDSGVGWAETRTGRGDLVAVGFKEWFDCELSIISIGLSDDIVAVSEMRHLLETATRVMG